MGICVCDCIDNNQTQSLNIIKFISYETNGQMNQIQLLFTNRPLHFLDGQCLVLYGDKSSQLQCNEIVKYTNDKIKKKLFQYIYLAQNFIVQNNLEHCIMPINIPKFSYNFMIIVKLSPWDGHHPQQIDQRLVKLTDKCFSLLKRKKIKIFTIVQIDQLFGIPSVMVSHVFSRILRKYSQSISKVTFMCKSIQSIEIYMKNIQHQQLNQNYMNNHNHNITKNHNQKLTENHSEDQLSNYF